MHKRSSRIISLFFFLLLIAGLYSVPPIVNAQAQESSSDVILLTARGPLTPVLEEYIERGLQIAEKREAELVVLELDTPGGSIELMNHIVQKIRGSNIPVVVFVSPRGAMAGSAGTIITLAGHKSAMAPETAIGAASPVGSQGEDIGETMESKTKEILKASVRTLTEGRNPEAVRLAEETIESAKALSASEAVEIGLIDLQAQDLDDLLTQLDGMAIDINGEQRILYTSDSAIYPVELTLIESMLQTLTNPNIVFLLLSIGVQAIFIELSNPGGWIAGFIGAVCLLLAIYGLGVLPINWTGFLFLLIAFILFVLDIKAPTHGALTTAGAISFITGSLILFNSQKAPGFPPVSVPLVIGTGIFISASFLLLITFALKAQKSPILTGKESLAGQSGLARTDIAPEGQVQVAGELWSAELYPGEETIQAGLPIQVVEVKGLHLLVKKKESPSSRS